MKLKIGDGFVVDATAQEAACASAKLHVAVNAKGQVVSIQKSGLGGIKPAVLTDMVQTAKRTAIQLIQSQDAALAAEIVARGEGVPRKGFQISTK